MVYFALLCCSKMSIIFIFTSKYGIPPSEMCKIALHALITISTEWVRNSMKRLYIDFVSGLDTYDHPILHHFSNYI